MKKFLYSAAALALAFFAASCQQENLEPVVSGNTVTYTVQVADAVATRALGDDITAVNELVYEVYRTVDEGETDFTGVDNLLYHKTAKVENGVATIEIEFVNDQNFTVLFWAHVKGNDVYDVDDLTEVSITSPDVANNVNAQAFVGRDFVRDCVSDNNGKVTLVRPVSQLNIATTPESLVFEAETGETGSTVVLEGSSVKVTGLATSYNIATLSAFGATATEYEYTETAVPGDVLTVNGKNYTYVAMNYVGFAPEMGTSDVTVSYVINTSEGNIVNEILNVPVKPNYRTNIIGNLITSKTDYTITLEMTWGENVPVEVVTSAFTLQQAIDNIPDGGEGEIVLDGDINFNELFVELTKSATQDVTFVTVPAGKEVVLNLNGYSITGVDQTQKNFGLIQNNGNLTVKNTAVKASKMSLVAEHNNGWNRYSAVISNNPAAELTVEGNVVIEHLGGTDMAYGIDALTNGTIGAVKTTIDGATVTSTYRAVRQFLNSASTDNELLIKRGSTIRGAENNKAVFFQDPSTHANKGKITIEEGASVSGVYLYVAEGSTEWPVEVSIAASSIAEGYEVVTGNVPPLYDVVLKDGYWTIETSLSLPAFVETVLAAEGTYDGEGQTVKILPLSGRSDMTNGCLIPDRLQKYGNPEVYYAQYQRFAELQNVNISNVHFVFVPTALNVQDAWNTAGAQTTAENVNGELQFMNVGSVTLTNCTFDKLAVSPIKASELTVSGCEFNDLDAYAIKDLQPTTAVINNNEFNNCNGGFWFNAAPATVTATGNTFTTVGRRGAIQFSTNGDYANTTFDITGNEVEGAFLWQLNETLTYAQYIQILEGNTYTTACVDGSVIPVQPPVAKVGNTEYLSIDEAIANWTNGKTLTLLDNVTLGDVITLKSTEHHILDLSTYTLTAAEGKNAFVIQACGTGDSERNAITIKANAENPGGINAGKKSIIYYKYADGGISGNDRPIIKIEGGVFTGSTSSFGTAGIYTIGTAARKCATLNITGGTFNCSINGSGKSKLLISGGTFNYSVGSQGDSTALRLIWGGKFKTLGFMTADSNNTKFWFGTSMANSNVGLYIDDEGYLVVGGPVITDFGDQFAAKATNATKWNSLLQYSSASTNGLYYTNAEMAIKKHGEANVVLK